MSVSVLDRRAWLRENRIGMQLGRHLLLYVVVDEPNMSIGATRQWAELLFSRMEFAMFSADIGRTSRNQNPNAAPA